MMNLEEKLWDYIDGNCSESERANIEVQLRTDVELARLHKEVLAIHTQLNNIDLDEPSMSFTRNVMEKVDAELKPVVLKTKVDQRIIYSISSFFVLVLLGIVGYAISQTNFEFAFSMPKIDFAINTNKLFGATALKIFLFVDILLILLYADSYFRKNRKQKKEA